MDCRVKPGNDDGGRIPMAIKFGRPIESKTRFVPPETSTVSLDLTHRPRRLRRSDWSRRMVRENEVTAADLIWPVFVADGVKSRAPIAARPGADRVSVDEIVREAERAAKL